jgi:hypothetical protein
MIQKHQSHITNHPLPLNTSVSRAGLEMPGTPINKLPVSGETCSTYSLVSISLRQKSKVIKINAHVPCYLKGQGLCR